MDWTMQDGPEETATERGLVPEGDHAFEIRSASEGAHKYRPGECLSLRLSAMNGTYQFVFCDIPKGPQGARLAVSLAKALGLGVGQTISINPAEIEGRTVRATVYHKVAASGRTYVNVERFAPDAEAAEPAAKRQAKKAGAAAAVAAPDDIPF